MKKILKFLPLVGFVKKILNSNMVRDRCHITRKSGGPADGKCNINAKQKQSIFFELYLLNSVFMIAHHPSENQMIKREKKKVDKLDIDFKTDEEHVSVSILQKQIMVYIGLISNRVSPCRYVF